LEGYTETISSWRQKRTHYIKTFALAWALSPDGGSLLCTLVERDDSDLVLVENFR